MLNSKKLQRKITIIARCNRKLDENAIIFISTVIHHKFKIIIVA